MVVFHSKLFAEDSIEGWKPLEERIDANIISTIHFKSVRADKIFKTYRNVKMCWVDKIRCLLFDDCKMLVNSRNGCYRYWILTAPHPLESPSLDLQWSEGNDWVTNISDIIPSSHPHLHSAFLSIVANYLANFLHTICRPSYLAAGLNISQTPRYQIDNSLK